jgi:hypothetical protein
MVTTPLTLTFTLASDQLAASPEAANENPITLVLQRQTPAPAEVAEAPLDAIAEDDELRTLSLVIEHKAGASYILDDGVLPPSPGQVSEDGVLVHAVSPLAVGCSLTFEGDAASLELTFERSLDLTDPLDTSPEAAPDETDEALNNLAEDDDDLKVLSLLVVEKAGASYTLDDGINPPSTGTVDADGVLIHPVSPQSTGATLQFEGDAEAIVLPFATHT